MISPKFFLQISECPTCRGWGTKNVPPLGNSDLCMECAGKGVFLSQSDHVYVWDAPAFVDYKSRKRVLVLILFTFVLVVAFLFLGYLFIRR